MNLRWRLKEYRQKNRRQRWDICEESTVWHFVTRSTGLKPVKPGMSSHFSESRDPRDCVSSAMCIQNFPEKNSELSPFGYSLHPLWVQALLGPVLVWKQQIYMHLHAVDREVFRVVLGLLLRWLSPKEKRAPKWVNEWVYRPTLNLSIFEIVFSLFAKSKFRIQIIKHTWAETCVFVKISQKYQIYCRRENGVDTPRLNHDALSKN